MLNLYHECRRSFAKDLLSASLTALPASQRSRSGPSSASAVRKQRPSQNEPYPSSIPTHNNKRQNEPHPRKQNKNFRQFEPYLQQTPSINFQKPNNRFKPSFHKGLPSSQIPQIPPPVITEDQVLTYFHTHVAEWRARPQTLRRLVSFGLSTEDTNKLLNAYVEEVQKGSLDSHSDYSLERFSQKHDEVSIDTIFSTIFFDWASRDEYTDLLANDYGVSPAALRIVKELVKVTSRVFPADEYPPARTMHRKIIMHVGPTNSGKTHHALRALAAARSGVYAGPLRLLAQEVWQRLNSGQIVPLGEDAETPVNPKGDPQYARLCNMVTGEEQKVMEGAVAHLSCTVEMITFGSKYDVAVIDEIQMIGDPQRGPGWMSAVLGVWAREVHLCGEETAVPIIRALLAHTGDELEIRQYERLTPLVIEEESLKGDLSKVRKGDCVVAFNRSGILAIKKSIEDKTGLRCAVVYGRLPPEVRAEQATLFNDPKSGYDVIVGSDCIGMGLNLKIKRVVFSATSKYDGRSVSALAVSTVKQIAGRAGRYGLHAEQADLGGTATTLYEEDLPHLKHCVATPYQPLHHARIGYTTDFLTGVLTVLPPDTRMHTALAAPKYIGRLPSYVRYADETQLTVACSFLDTHWKDMMLSDKMSLLYSPIPWRDTKTVDVLRAILSQQGTGDVVEFMQAMQGTGLLEVVDELENKMRMEEAGLVSRSRAVPASLIQLESLHKVLGLYLWMSYRNRLLYSETELVRALKDRLEVVLNWSLDRLSGKIQKAKGLRALVQSEVSLNTIDGEGMSKHIVEPTDSGNMPLF